MKLLIVAGGGGHFAAALAVIQALPEDVEVLVVGRKYAFEGDTALSWEYQTTQRLGILFAALESGRLQRKFTKQTIASIGKIPKGLNGAVQILRGFTPDVVISFGGYIALPIVIASSWMKIPIVLHEQTFGAGLANKISAKFAKKICLSWHESEPLFPKAKIILTGNPVKKELLDVLHVSKSEAKKKALNELSHPSTDLPLIYITGGSGGSHAINEVVKEALGTLLHSYIVIHQTGDSSMYKDFDGLSASREVLPDDVKGRYVVRKFVTSDEVALIMRASDVVVGRSGVNTVTELALLKKPSLLIPLQTGQKHEQLTNARFLEEIGLGVILEQTALTPQSLLANIEKVLHNSSEGARDSAILQERIIQAPKKIVEVITDVYKQTTAEKKGKKK